MLENSFLLEVRKHRGQRPSGCAGVRAVGSGVGAAHETTGRQGRVGAFVAERGDGDLLEIVGTGHSVGRFAHLLHSGHQKTD